MTTVFEQSFDERDARWLRELERAMMAATFAASSDLSANERRALISQWVASLFNAASDGIDCRSGVGAGMIEWHPVDRTRFDLIYHSVTGVGCVLGRAYQQPNGSWASLVIAGVKNTAEEAEAAAEWAVSRLVAD